MENSILERIANALTTDDLQDKGKDNVQFCVTDELAPRDINIEVDGLGLMTLPVSQTYIQKLINISSKAQFGLREQTILDENIRNSYEIKSDKLHISINEQSLTAMLSKIRDSLGLSGNSVLTAHLHNMLIYQPGQFFDMHQDSEKLENMVASLVVVLPSPHIGGDLIIEHGKKKKIFSSENIDQSNAKCIGFYADCKHKVEKIKQGYRIALTYNLVLKSEEICNIKNVNQQLTDAIKDYFDIEVNKQPQNKQPQRLVYFLNHSYTEHSLRWSMLKGADRANASALYGVAQELSLIPHLALVEIRQSWTTDGDDRNSTIDELIDDEVTLSYWIDSNNKKLPFSECDIDEDEICWTKETESLEPYNTEYEGYMGNYGNTMDYWYRRAAIVLWSESSQIPMNFMLNYDNAIDELYVLTSSLDNEKEVMEIIAKAGKYLYRTFYKKDKNDFEILANIALYIKDKDTALSILSHFKWEILNSDIIKLLVKLQIQYGINWCIDLLNNWKNHERDSKDCFIKEIHSFVQNFLYYDGAASIVELLLDTQSNTLIDSDQEAYKWQKPVKLKESLPKRIAMFYQTLAACAAINNISVLDKVIEHLISSLELYPETSLAELFFKLQGTVPTEYFAHYKLLKDHLVQIIDNQLALGMRPEDDWSIDAKLPCKCEHCKIATNFLHSKTEITKIWPILAAIRDHITNMFNGLDLPVNLSVERKGSPHKLIMVKTELLHKNAKKRFDELKFYQQKLQTNIKN
ncbi:2OG-Fe(II) oxygenase [Candidatus Tisiphia endosymbiont of Oplodontha viridula]|uniref:2OG-Fe(II) oxygenase n=1 Tax=Candidatus Tisiphia endosymbiont of Oplodontha viridula TaxID=3077925 RepID=UPI0035C8E509